MEWIVDPWRGKLDVGIASYFNYGFAFFILEFAT
jgi:hypothetical protein